MQKLCESLTDDPDFLQKRPVLVNLVDSKYNVYGGNQRVRAAKQLGWKTIPCDVDENLSEKLMKDRVIKDNKTFGDFDYDLLANEYEIPDLLKAGFTPNELAIDIKTIEEIEQPEDNEQLEPPKDPITKPGDIYELLSDSGLRHVIGCGDSTDPDFVSKILQDNIPGLIYNDPPYGISYHRSDGKLHGNAKAKRNKFNPILNDDSNSYRLF